MDPNTLLAWGSALLWEGLQNDPKYQNTSKLTAGVLGLQCVSKLFMGGGAECYCPHLGFRRKVSPEYSSEQPLWYQRMCSLGAAKVGNGGARYSTI